MLREFLESIGIAPTIEMTAVISICAIVFAVLAGWMTYQYSAQQYRDTPSKPADVLRSAYTAYNCYRLYEKPVTDIMVPVLLAFQSALHQREGGDSPTVSYEIAKTHVIMQARGDRHWELLLPFTAFDDLATPVRTVTGMVQTGKYAILKNSNQL